MIESCGRVDIRMTLGGVRTELGLEMAETAQCPMPKPSQCAKQKRAKTERKGSEVRKKYCYAFLFFGAEWFL